MPKTGSKPLPLGTPAPGFRLPDGTGADHDLSDYAAPALLVVLISNRCPFVVGIRDAFADLARRNVPRGLQVIAINSNDAAAHPEETPAEWDLPSLQVADGGSPEGLPSPKGE